MRTTKILSITLPPKMLAQAERVAEQENRTKSELFREALRQYLAKQEFDALLTYGRKRSKALGIKPSDVNRLVGEYRSEQRAKRKK